MKTSLKLAVITATTLASVPTVYSATWVADARGNAMGNTGVTTADYLLAPFYNPALTAVYKDVDDVGILLPGISVAARDTDESLSTIDDIQDAIDDFDESATQSNINDLNGYLDDLDGNSPLTVDANLGAAIALPMESLSLNLFARGYAEIIATPDVAAKTGTDAASTRTRYENSEVNLIAFGYTEVGIALAKKLAIAGQTVAVGISPKIQQIRTYKETVTVEDFDLSDYDESEKKKSTLNLDLGAAWLIENYRAGIAVKDLFAQKIKTFDGENTYHLNTQVTVSGAYVTPFFTAAVDMDLTKQKRYESSGDDTQFLRLGIEGDAWGWAQLRAGYEIDMKNNIDDSFTAGIGISPGDVVSIDVAGTYAGENQMGVSANLAFTF
ncbi:type IX secretion system membrane protein PorP/SprF [Vibrio sp. CAIM 722]|uniref:Type IX secretion system membrane protein PorP/SprF n=1 Tax=Vibrio eleionomae TaxID=2653505 RepID=A0A7X4LML1_9VIBR|nr:conjugal transfer protein TraF [Vibrio eleionomae]MZI94550.1 type IX secretion system membrane protein PorP/SprF [Vibrio eleionomae]